jgi:hypothetical protein
MTLLWISMTIDWLHRPKEGIGHAGRPGSTVSKRSHIPATTLLIYLTMVGGVNLTLQHSVNMLAKQAAGNAELLFHKSPALIYGPGEDDETYVGNTKLREARSEIMTFLTYVKHMKLYHPEQLLQAAQTDSSAESDTLLRGRPTGN